MRKIIFTIALLASSLLMNATAIGTWKAYMAYHDITEIQKGGNNLYILASDNLYSYNQNDQSVRTYDKANVLSDCNITHIAWCQAAKRLVITYKDENIDLLDETGNVTNISDYYSKSMTEDKTINSIDIADKYAYLSTGFGILKLNIADGEISDTYNLGFKVNYSYISNGKIYAASNDKGLYSALLTANLLDKSNWSRVGDYVARSSTIDPDLLAKAQSANPGGPKYNYFGFLKFYNGSLYTCGGGFSANADLARKGTLQVLKEDNWQIYEDKIDTITKGISYVDLGCLDIDPTDNNHVFAGGRTGLYEFNDGKFLKHYSIDNSPLKSALTNNKDYVIVLGILFDKSGNIWCLNGNNESSTSILEYTKENTWNNFHKSSLEVSGTSFRDMKGLMKDSRNLMWFVNDHWISPALVSYDSTNDKVNVYNSFINEDGTKVNVTYARCVSEDTENNIWVGTDVGPLQLTSSEITNGETTFNQVKIPRNDGTDYADYLLSGADITSIAIDGGGRKWFGTNGNGLYLISADNLTQIQHFTKENSPLLSDNIESIAINPTTGEVYFGTDCGLCSYMSDAAQPATEMTKDDVYAYPNPVRPDYTGLITITGLTYDADVKIVTNNGVLVNEGRSNGGFFTWNGCDNKGKRVASGVYMVITATNDGTKGTVCKIAVIN